MTICQLMGIPLEEKPDFGTYLAFELHKNKANDYFVKVIFRQIY